MSFQTTSGVIQVNFITLLWSAEFWYLTGSLKIVASPLALPLHKHGLNVTAAVMETNNDTIIITFYMDSKAVFEIDSLLLGFVVICL